MSVSAPVARPHSRSAALKAALETSRWLPPPAPSCLSSHSLNNFITRPACSARTSRSCCSVMEGPCLLPWRSPGALLASIASQLSACGLPLTEWSVTEPRSEIRFVVLRRVRTTRGEISTDCWPASNKRQKLQSHTHTRCTLRQEHLSSEHALGRLYQPRFQEPTTHPAA